MTPPRLYFEYLGEVDAQLPVNNEEFDAATDPARRTNRKGRR